MRTPRACGNPATIRRMHVHILGICGTFMGGVAALAREAGHRVTGSDANVYPPMSDQLRALDIGLIEGWDPRQLDPAPDLVVVGNALSRGNPCIEALLTRGLRCMSGPEFLASQVLHGRWTLAVAGTHGKTTTSSMLAWILDDAGLEPGFLIGGIPADFGVSARLGSAPFFVVEADEYDSAFFDKRSKFVHYRPRTAVLNNLEFDHADIFRDLGAIQRQFHHLVRTIPGDGLIVHNADDAALDAVLALGCWTPRESFGAGSKEPRGDWRACDVAADGSAFRVEFAGKQVGEVAWSQSGLHNVANALAAIASARHAGVPVAAACKALGVFRGVKRRLELVGSAAGVAVYDDFAHHPTAIRATLDGLRRRVGAARILAVLEPRSATMRMGVHRTTLGPALAGADLVFLHAPADLGWDLAPVLSALGARGATATSVDAAVAAVTAAARPGDHVLVMSNGGFGGIHARLLAALVAPR